MTGFIDCLEVLEDRRKDINKAYELTDIIFLTMAAVMSGATGWQDIQLFGTYKLEWLRQYRPFENGIPTRHTIGRIIRGISAVALMDAFAVWINQQREKSGHQHIAFDGKTLRGSGHNNHVEAIHMMSAMVAESGITLFQVESRGKKNEIKTLQDMLDVIPVKGHVLSADAMHCQKKTLAKALKKEADVVLQVKDNQKTLKAEIAAWFHKCQREDADKMQCINETDGGHGRIVERCYRLLPADDWVSELEEWSGIKSLVEVSRTHHKKDKIVTEVSYHISTLEKLEKISEVIRQHWRIESHHWILDVTFHEDESLIYAEDGAKNMALFRRMLLNLAKGHPSKGSMASKLKKAGWDDDFRAELLFG
jgi:predicted transposase YbfD/YdcC